MNNAKYIAFYCNCNPLPHNFLLITKEKNAMSNIDLRIFDLKITVRVRIRSERPNAVFFNAGCNDQVFSPEL